MTIERAREYPIHESCRGPDWADPDCIVCTHPEELFCARGDHCVGRSWKDGKGVAIGHVLDADPYTDADRIRDITAFVFPSLPDVLFCEDCATHDIMESRDEYVLDGTCDGYGYTIYVTDDPGRSPRFGFVIFTVDRTAAIDWEWHSPDHFRSLGAAVTWCRTEIERRIASELDAEVGLEEVL